MRQATGEIRTLETQPTDAWPVHTKAVSYVGSACAAEGASDFHLDDLNLVRHQFPGRRVTLDGDVITVWPTSPPNGAGTPAP